MRKKIISFFLILLLFFIPMSAVTQAATDSTTINLHNGIVTNNTTGKTSILNAANATSLSNATSSSSSPTISGYPFDSPQAPIGNYMFDSNGWQGNFDPIYWVSNIIFVGTVSMMFFALNFYKIGASTNGLDGFFNIALKILHQGFIGMAVPLMPLAVLALIGVFLWFGFIKKDLPSVFGRAIKMMAVFIVIAMLASPTVINSKMVESIAQFPVTMGDTVGGLIEKLINSSWSSKTQALGGNTEDQAWDGIVLNEWISGEEGKNYSADGSKVVSLTVPNTPAWRQVLAQPLQGSNRNQVVGVLQKTPDGPNAFSSGNRFSISIPSFIGNLGPILYFFAIGLILLGAKLAFIVLVAAGAVILPLELFPVTRSTALTLKWVQWMAMTLFVSFYLTVYSAFLFGLSDDVTTAIQNSGNFSGALMGSFFFLLQGVVYLVAIWLAWFIYKRMKPMQKIQSTIARQSKRGVPLGFGQRLTAEARRSNPWEQREINRKSIDPDRQLSTGARARNSDLAKSALRKTAEGIRDAKALGRLEAAAKHHHDQYDADNQPKDEPIIVDESELRTNDDFFDDVPKSNDPPIVDREEPTYHFAPTERVTAETKNNKSWKDVVPQKDEPKLKKGNDDATGKVSTIDKWETRANKVANAVKMVSNPDEAMDAIMGATLGFAASKVVSAGKGAAFNYVRALAREKEMKNYKQPLPQKAKRQTDPKTKKGTKKIEISVPDQQFAEAYKREMNKPTPATSNDSPQQSPGTTKKWTTSQDDFFADAPTQRPEPIKETVHVPAPNPEPEPVKETATAPTSNPIKETDNVPSLNRNTTTSPTNTQFGDRQYSEPKTEPHDRETVTTVQRPSFVRQSKANPPVVKPMPVMRMRDASVSLIKNAKLRNQTRAERVKRVARTTPVTLPKRPSLKPKKPSLADRIFGGKR
jgi:hypothetical protein